MGPRMLMIHGSAADHTTWSIQLAGPLASQVRLIAYDRRAADDLEPAIVVGSSFGAVVALDAIRRYPARFRGAVLIEPPTAASDEALAVNREFFAAFDRTVETAGGPAAAEHPPQQGSRYNGVITKSPTRYLAVALTGLAGIGLCERAVAAW